MCIHVLPYMIKPFILLFAFCFMIVGYIENDKCMIASRSKREADTSNKKVN